MSRPPPIGVIPAAGLGSRLAPLGYPKELLPIIYTVDAGRAVPRPVVLASLEQMHRAGITQCIIVVAEWKLELVRVLGESAAGVALSYVVRSVPRGLADAAAAPAPWLADRDVCLALPDTLVAPDDAIARVRAAKDDSLADLVLGVFPTDEAERLGPVRVRADGVVLEVLDKPAATDLRNTWGVAIWSPRFGEFLHDALAREDSVVLGDVFHRAAGAGLAVRAVAFPEGRFIDVGTPEGLAAALRSSA